MTETSPPSSPPAGPVGWLARALVTADQNLRAAERQVEDFLTALLVEWRGWAFTAHSTRLVELHVYQARDTAKAVAALHRAGFTSVTIHSHRAERFLSCPCLTHESTPSPPPKGRTP